VVINNLISGLFVISLWWKELTFFAVLISLAGLASVRIALRNAISDRALEHENAVNLAERLKELTEQR